MNLQNIFEKMDTKTIKGASNKEKDGHQDINIRDPLLKRKIQKAGAYTGYAETDLEAVVKQWAREQERDQEQIDDLKDREEKLEKNVKRLRDREDELEKDLETETKKRKTKINQLHAQFDADIAEIEDKTTQLANKDKEYAKKIADLSKKAADYDYYANAIDRLDKQVDTSTKKVEASTAKHAKELQVLKDLEKEYEAKISDIYDTLENVHKIQDVASKQYDIALEKQKDLENRVYNEFSVVQTEWDTTQEEASDLIDNMKAALLDIAKSKETLSGEKLDRQELEDELVSQEQMGRLHADEMQQAIDDMSDEEFEHKLEIEKQRGIQDYIDYHNNKSQGRNPQTGEPIDLSGRDKRPSSKKTKNESKIMEADSPLIDREDFLAKSKELFNLQNTWAVLLDKNKVTQEDYNEMIEFIQKRILRLRVEAIKKGIITEAKKKVKQCSWRDAFTPEELDIIARNKALLRKLETTCEPDPVNDEIKRLMAKRKKRGIK